MKFRFSQMLPIGDAPFVFKKYILFSWDQQWDQQWTSLYHSLWNLGSLQKVHVSKYIQLINIDFFLSAYTHYWSEAGV